MATDTRTPVLGLLKQGTGNSNNTWGELLNTQVIDLIEKAIAGYALVVVTGASDVTLDDDEYICPVIEFTGTLTADQIIILPNLSRGWKFYNNTSGEYFVLVKASGGTPVNAPQGCTTQIFCDGDGHVVREDADDVGEIFFYGGTTPPPGAFECNAAAKKRASAVDLYSKVGTTWGSSDSTDFLLPSAYIAGKFLRSRTASIAVGTAQASQNKTHTHSAAGTTGGRSAGHVHSGSGTTGTQSSDHVHSGVVVGGTSSTTGGGAFSVVGSLNFGSTGSNSVSHAHAYSFTSGGESGDHVHSFSITTGTGSADGTEARPESLVALMCIRY